jgi:hypothetical protein
MVRPARKPTVVCKDSTATSRVYPQPLIVNRDTPPSALRLPLTAILAITVPPLALAAWILLSGGMRELYFRSGWIRAGAATLTVGALPLLTVIVLAKIGLWPDPNPNPIGLGLLFVSAAALASVLTLIGMIRVATRPGDE